MLCFESVGGLLLQGRGRKMSFGSGLFGGRKEVHLLSPGLHSWVLTVLHSCRAYVGGAVCLPSESPSS